MKKLILLFLIINLSLHASLENDFIKLFSNNDPVNPELNLSAAAGGGFISYILLRSFQRRILGIKDNRLTYLINICVSSVLPGLTFKDLIDDSKINGSFIKDLSNAIKSRSKSIKELLFLLIKKAGMTNVIVSLLGAIIADHIATST